MSHSFLWASGPDSWIHVSQEVYMYIHGHTHTHTRSRLPPSPKFLLVRRSRASSILGNLQSSLLTFSLENCSWVAEEQEILGWRGRVTPPLPRKTTPLCLYFPVSTLAGATPASKLLMAGSLCPSTYANVLNWKSRRTAPREMSNQGSGLHFLLKGMLTKQEETETNTVKLTLGDQPARTESSKGCLWPMAKRSLTRARLLALLSISQRWAVKWEKTEASPVERGLWGKGHPPTDTGPELTI